MAAVVRIKRKRHEDPLETLVLACKRSRDSSGQEASFSSSGVKSVFDFIGTLNHKDDPVTVHVKEAIKSKKLQQEYKHHHPENFSTKVRPARNHVNKAQRYKIQSKKRALHIDGLENQNESGQEKGIERAGNEYEQKRLKKDIDSDKLRSDTTKAGNTSGDFTTKDGGASGDFTTKDGGAGGDFTTKDGATSGEFATKDGDRVYCLYDLVEEEENKENIEVEPPPPSTILCNNVPMVREKVQPTQDCDYVYDLYYTNNKDFDFQLFENLLTVEAFGEEYNFSDYRSNMDEEIYDDEDDSNEEDNWRNDYPDEEEDDYHGDSYHGDGYKDRLDYEDSQDNGFNSDGEPVSELMSRNCHIGDEDLSSDDEDHVYFNDSWNLSVNYDTYRSRMARMLAKPESSDEDE